MSFRVRVLALFSLVALAATGATASLAFTQAARQAAASATTDRRAAEEIATVLADYARDHGTWYGVSEEVRRLALRTHQRIRLVADEFTVDSDELLDGTARPVVEPPVLVDPTPSLVLTGDAEPSNATLQAISAYRSEVRFGACLTRLGITLATSRYPNGIPRYTADSSAEPGAVAGCAAESRAGLIADDPAVTDAVVFCRDEQPPESTIDCLQKAFARFTAEVGPAPLRLYLGADGDTGPSLALGPVLAAAGLVALLALSGTALLGRRVLRPVDTLTAAAQRLGDGDLSLRVPVRGRDELAQLATSFNRMADSLQRGEERQRRLVADVAHELRTPLANLRGYLEALKDGVLPGDAALFANLHREAVLQQRIVDDLQDLALAEAGVLAYHRTNVDLAELLETCRDAHQAVADAAGVALRVDTAGPVTVHADPDRLRQVVGNLVTNALRATPSGGTVTLTAATRDGFATVTVQDTGMGVAADDLPHIFDRFWRADAARSRSTGGSGLGLAIARQIVADHAGHIAADSRPGEGTTITITLP